MCRRVECSKCGRPTFAGCGAHVEQVLRDVPRADRCRCRRVCPNVRPASAALRALGRPNASVLDLPTRFADDWADNGYPVERG
jgi:hypothetical protein